MFTKNYYNSLMSYTTGATIPKGLVDYSNTVRDSVYSPTTYTYAYYAFPRYAMSKGVKTSTANNEGVMFGDGNTPATINDTALAGNLITTISVSVSFAETVDDMGCAVNGTFVVTNTGSNEITIREAVMYLRCPYNSSGGSFPCVIDRTVLDTPVTIPAGGIGQVTYTIRMNYPTA